MNNRPTILMYGWEFPPYVSGGLGVACHAIAEELMAQGANLTVVLPYTLDDWLPAYDLVVANNQLARPRDREMSVVKVGTQGRLNPYTQKDGWGTSQESLGEFLSLLESLPLPEELKSLVGSLRLECDEQRLKARYTLDLITEVFKYAALAGRVAKKIEHEIIYAHDWLTILAAYVAKKSHGGAPVVMHVHALEIDRSEGYGDRRVYAIEKFGMEQADHIIAVSQYTKERIVRYYRIDPAKITVVHNGINTKTPIPAVNFCAPVILFVGRLTYQKSPYFFIEMAKRVLAKYPEAQFVLAGQGDLFESMIEHVAASQLGTNVHFTGFLDAQTLAKLYALASVYVMPSISEPFGLTALEAAASGVPVVISKQSGSAEVLVDALTADFWDIEEFTNKILALIEHPTLAKDLAAHAKQEVETLTWHKAVQKIIRSFQSVLEGA